MHTYKTKDTIYAESIGLSEINAVLNGRKLFIKDGDTIFPFKRMIEYNYEIPGWAVLAFNNDSSWAKVILNPYVSLDVLIITK